MTTTEAIKQLQTEHDLIANECDLDGSQFAPALLEALAMAIEVLRCSEIPNSSGKDTNVPSKDTIYRQDAIDAAKAHWYKPDIAGAIEQLPSADVQPVVHGEWIPVDSYSAFGGDEATWMAHGNPIAFHYCSECGKDAYAGEDGEELLTDFCPSCGADMRGKQDG